MNCQEVKLTVAVDTQKTAATYLDAHCKGFMVFIPPLVGPSSVQLEVFVGDDPDQFSAGAAVLLASTDTNWFPVDTVLIANAIGSVSSVAQNWKLGGRWVRFAASAVQAASQTFKLFYSAG